MCALYVEKVLLQAADLTAAGAAAALGGRSVHIALRDCRVGCMELKQQSSTVSVAPGDGSYIGPLPAHTPPLTSAAHLSLHCSHNIISIPLSLSRDLSFSRSSSLLLLISIFPPTSSLLLAMSGKGKSSSSSSQSSSSSGGSYGHNSQGNHYCTRGDSTASGGAYHYSNTDGSYYYQNNNGSTYYNNGAGNAVYTPPSANPRNAK